MQRVEGYQLVAIFEKGAPYAVAAAGFRGDHMLAWGRFVYVEDLSTLPEARRRGYGRQLMDWLTDEARRLGCDQLHLDSDVTADLYDAHRLYLNSGLAITSGHFAEGFSSPRQAAPRPRARTRLRPHCGKR